MATETQDARIPVERAKLPDGRVVNTSERFEQGRNFANKFWNSARFALMNLEGYEPRPIALEALPIEDRWILSRLAATTAESTSDLEAFRFAESVRRLREFTWDSFCDWYVELVKARLRDPDARPTAQHVLATVLDALCRLLHPILPFVTEQVWQALRDVAPRRGLIEPREAAESVCVADWPAPLTDWPDVEAERTVAHWQEKIGAIRNLKAERGVAKNAEIAPILLAAGPVAEMLRRGEPHLKALTNATRVTIAEWADRPEDSAVAVLADAEVILPLEGLIDKAAEAAKARKALGDVEKQLNATRAKLSNESFLTRAPAEVVEGLRAKEAELVAQGGSLSALLAKLAGAGGTSAR